MNALINRPSLFDEVLKDFFSPAYVVRPLHGDGLPNPAQIRVDVHEDGNAYVVEAEVPGVRKEEIDVTIDGAVVTLKAEVKQQDRQTEGNRVLRTERYYGAVARSFQLPQEVDAGKAEARYDNGILRLTLPKLQVSSQRRIAVA